MSLVEEGFHQGNAVVTLTVVLMPAPLAAVMFDRTRTPGLSPSLAGEPLHKLKRLTGGDGALWAERSPAPPRAC